jgi:hypothetical protein
LSSTKGYSFTGAGKGTVEISIDGGTNYTSLTQYDASSPAVLTNPFTNNAKTTINLSAYLGQPNVKIRFNFVGAGSTSTWAIDEVNVVGPYQPITYTWGAGFAVSASGDSATITPPTAGLFSYVISTARGDVLLTILQLKYSLNTVANNNWNTTSLCSCNKAVDRLCHTCSG